MPIHLFAFSGSLRKGSFNAAVLRAAVERIAAADALLIVTPEYNSSMPGVLENAIDWAPRPPDQPEVFIGAGGAGGLDAEGRPRLDALPLDHVEHAEDLTAVADHQPVAGLAPAQ